MIRDETVDKMPLGLRAGFREIRAIQLLYCDRLHLFKKRILWTITETGFVVPV
jgi:hypothetical protein